MIAPTPPVPSTLHFDDLRALQSLVPGVDLAGVRSEYAELVHRIRHAGIPVSDRRAVKLQRLVASSALLSGRVAARLADLWVLKYIWDTEEQQEVLGALVQNAVDRSPPDPADQRRARAADGPNPESLARDLEYLETQAKAGPNGQRAYLLDRLALLEGRCQWVADPAQREFLSRRVAELWTRLKGA